MIVFQVIVWSSNIIEYGLIYYILRSNTFEVWNFRVIRASDDADSKVKMYLLFNYEDFRW